MDGQEEELGTAPQLDFPVVGIGASAGGLEAVTTMFRKVDTGMGMAYVLVMHLDPDHESLMVELLSRKTQIRVRQIADGDDLEVDCLHVIPPGSSLRIEDGLLRLDAFSEPRGLRRPIDSFFTSLAHSQGEKAACVVLSGTGADGTAGLQVVKELGGISIVQSPEEARYDGMPFSAISTKLSDFTLPAAEIVPRIKTYFDGANSPTIPDDEEADRIIGTISSVISENIGQDFSGYKKSTLFRRLNRRMQILEFADPEDYTRFLKSSASEQQELAQDFLINVTSFFRDPENFEILKRTVIHPLIARSELSDEIRFWVPGCSSGQEAYTLAMLVHETCTELQHKPLIQIFGTDIDETMIALARRAQYPVSMFNELPKHYQDAYTFGLDGKFEIVKEVREMVRFSFHNVIQDPPFSKIDLISCRNLLIYLGEELQKGLFPLLHFSLKPDGHLFLGTSENVTRRGELFHDIDQRARIFKRNNATKRMRLTLPLGGTNRNAPSSGKKQTLSRDQDFPRHQSMDATNAVIYEQYAPPFVRVAHDGRILDSSGDLSLFLMTRPADERHLHSLARDEVRNVIFPLIAGAVKESRRCAVKDVEISSPFGVQKTDIVAHPMKDDTVAVIFLVKDRLKPVVDEFEFRPIPENRRIADLQEELQANRLLLKSKVEEIETANEELKSSNEEMMSMNEELQSANEELTTANEELKNKIDELTLVNADLDNFLKSVDLAMIVLDRAKRIRHVTDAARQVLPIKRSDQGRYITEFNINFGHFDLTKTINDVMDTGDAFTRTTELNEDGKAFFVRITPYVFADGSVNGVSITLVDITDEYKLRNSLDLESQRLKLALEAGRIGIIEVDVETQAVSVDSVMARQVGLLTAGVFTMDEVTQNFHPEDLALFSDNLARAVEEDTEYEFDFRVNQPGEDTRWIRTRGLAYTSIEGTKKVLAHAIDVTDRRSAIEHREMLLSEMSHRIKNLFAVISGIIQSVPKSGDEAKQLSEDLNARIVSLGKAYDLARRSTSKSGVHLRDLLKSVVSPHVSTQSISFDGPPILVSQTYLNTFTLIVHELATNAAKYGALGNKDGKLDVTWTVTEDNRIKLVWKEDTPGFKQGKTKRGFGSRLIETSVRQLVGEFERSFTKSGAVVNLLVTLSINKSEGDDE